MKRESQIPFVAVRRTKASREIVAQIRDMLASGHLTARERLPSERDLATRLGVGRSTLREAVRVLETLGLVEVRPGEGTFLRWDNATSPQGHLPSELFSRWTMQLHLIELRTVLEPGLAGLAARRATADHLAKMRDVLEAQAAEVKRGASGMAEDVAFHRLIADATGNPALRDLMQQLTALLDGTRARSLQRDDRPTRSLRQNRAILAAIESRHPVRAARRMRDHIRSLERGLFATGPQPVEFPPPLRGGNNGFHPSPGRQVLGERR